MEHCSALNAVLNRAEAHHRELLEASRAIADSLCEEIQRLNEDRDEVLEELKRAKLSTEAARGAPPKQDATPNGQLHHSARGHLVAWAGPADKLDQDRDGRAKSLTLPCIGKSTSEPVVALATSEPVVALASSGMGATSTEHSCAVPEMCHQSHSASSRVVRSFWTRGGSPRLSHGTTTSVLPQSLEERTHSRDRDSITARKIRAPRSTVQILLTYKPRARLARLVFSSRFESVTLLLVVINSVMLPVETDFMARHDLQDPPAFFLASEAFFLSSFLLEVGARVMADWQYYFRGPGRVLNIVDSILIFAQSIELLSSLITSGDFFVNLSQWRCFRLMRAVRIGRSVRVLVLLQDLRACCMAMFMSLKPFAGAAAVFGLWVMVVAVYFTERALVLRRSLVNDDAAKHHLQVFFGSVPRSMLTLFQSITGGLDWESISGLFPSVPDTLLFVVFVAFSLLVLMNIIAGVIIQNVMKSAEEDKLSCLLPSAEQVLNAIAPREGCFREDVLKCLSDTRVLVTGFTGRAAAANGEYVKSENYFHGLPVYAQVNTADAASEPWVIYCLNTRRWCLGPDLHSVEAWKASTEALPPTGDWIASVAHDEVSVRHVGAESRQQLKALLQLMEIDHEDVEAIFNLCDPSAGEVDMTTFLSKFVDVRAPARRLEVLRAARSGMSRPTHLD